MSSLRPRYPLWWRWIFSRAHPISDTFVSGFDWLNTLGSAAQNGHQSFCRQSLLGGNSALLDTATFEPNPDYYSSLLFKRLMGKEVFSTEIDKSTPQLRVYAHCERRDSKETNGITLMIINFGDDSAEIDIPDVVPSKAEGSERHEYLFTNVRHQ
eukprot:TRINITY_DN12354_c0_g1_i1.p1 TRINITY_DN12354_c0_g1~~TRINITY_DN12354_c0_g1_i1.p1  ORF type:complete len:155 (-),score=19.88 TRINITY_DN12354_c0_g1_i1:22-486(-)